MDASNDPSRSQAESPGSQTPPRRSLWRVSLGGLLIFAAGMMVGFAPMRAWLFFREDPDFVEIEVILFDVDSSESDKIRPAFSEAPSSDAARKLDPVQVLASGTPSRRILSKPTIMTMMGHEARIQVVAQRLARTSPSPGGSNQFDVIDVSFTPSLRPSGQFDLQYRIKHSSTRTDQGGTPSGSDEVSTESSAIVENGVWHLIEIGSPTQSDVDEGRTRWLIVKAKPIETMR